MSTLENAKSIGAEWTKFQLSKWVILEAPDFSMENKAEEEDADGVLNRLNDGSQQTPLDKQIEEAFKKRVTILSEYFTKAATQKLSPGTVAKETTIDLKGWRIKGSDHYTLISWCQKDLGSCWVKKIFKHDQADGTSLNYDRFEIGINQNEMYPKQFFLEFDKNQQCTKYWTVPESTEFDAGIENIMSHFENFMKSPFITTEELFKLQDINKWVLNPQPNKND